MVSSASGPSPMKEQRRSPRIKQQLVVELHDKNGARTVQSMDVGRHGLFIATGREPPPRERHLVQLTVHLPDGAIKAAASVTRHFKNEGVDGVGVQFFALSDDAKQRWDDFIFSLQRNSSNPMIPAPSFGPAPERESGVGGATFLVKLKTIERLRDFASTHLASGGTVLFTPVLRAPGEVVTLVVVHPKSDEEFRLPGIIHKAHEDRPKRLDIHFHGITPALLSSFEQYIETGHPPRVQLDPPVVPPSQRVAQEQRDLDLDLDVDVFDEDTLDTDDRIWGADAPLPATKGERSFTLPPFSDLPTNPLDLDMPPPPVADAKPDTKPVVPVSAGPDPGLKPSTYLLRCDHEGCASEPYAVDLGACRGVLGLVADHGAYVSNKTSRVATAPRLIAPDEREARTKQWVSNGGRLASSVDVATLLAAVALAETAKDPETGTPLKSTRAVERLEHAARRLKEGDAAAKTKVPCVTCKEGHLTVEKIS